MTFLPSRLRARVASFAVACAVWLSAASLPLQSEAAPQQSSSHMLTQFKTSRGENTQFIQNSDGSITVVRYLNASPVGFRRSSTPLGLFQELEPGQQAPSSLREGNTNFLNARGAVGSLERIHGSQRVAQGPGPKGLQARISNQNWFRNAFCNPPGVSYSSCYTPAWNWAYLDSTGDSYGHAVAYAINAPLQFTVDGSTWRIRAGQGLEVWVYGFLFNFQASVANAQWFDFESDVVYTF